MPSLMNHADLIAHARHPTPGNSDKPRRTSGNPECRGNHFVKLANSRRMRDGCFVAWHGPSRSAACPPCRRAFGQPDVPHRPRRNPHEELTALAAAVLASPAPTPPRSGPAEVHHHRHRGRHRRLLRRGRRDLPPDQQGPRPARRALLGRKHRRRFENNVNTIKAGELDFGVSQSDIQFQRPKGEVQFKDGGAFAEPAPGVLAAPRAADRAGAQGKPTSAKMEDFRASASTSATRFGPARRWRCCCRRWACHADFAGLRTQARRARRRAVRQTRSMASPRRRSPGNVTSRTRPPPAAPSWCRSPARRSTSGRPTIPTSLPVTIPGKLYANNS